MLLLLLLALEAARRVRGAVALREPSVLRGARGAEAAARGDGGAYARRARGRPEVRHGGPGGHAARHQVHGRGLPEPVPRAPEREAGAQPHLLQAAGALARGGTPAPSRQRPAAEPRGPGHGGILYYTIVYYTIV